MTETADFGPVLRYPVVTVKPDDVVHAEQAIATEIPFTIVASDVEIATMQCSPSDLTELCYGFLLSTGFINTTEEILSCSIDTTRWVAELELEHVPDLELMGKRLYTSGCGKGVTYASLDEASARMPVVSGFSITREQVFEMARWLQRASSVYRDTRGIHTAALSTDGDTPSITMDDIGRHNAVDKVIGKGLMTGLDFSRTALVCSGRVSSEILQKARRAGIAVLVARGAPTHQSILRAQDMEITIVGFARGTSFTVFTHEERIELS
ncbi:formate dehydrogenase accessory sulfurtransferase FdhD [Candidatus Eisenbacteria bacterium]|uniref:Sulfur carrier protein FdhD n=1 Tax=Eiseniibacteriota bacterium TaxID=2212470 RepID=A0ABV6YIM6_UNCEI